MINYIKMRRLRVINKKYENLSRIESVIFPELFVEVAEYKPLAHWK